jgi:hypothetical protein
MPKCTTDELPKYIVYLSLLSIFLSFVQIFNLAPSSKDLNLRSCLISTPYLVLTYIHIYIHTYLLTH